MAICPICKRNSLYGTAICNSCARTASANQILGHQHISEDLSDLITTTDAIYGSTNTSDDYCNTSGSSDTSTTDSSDS